MPVAAMVMPINKMATGSIQRCMQDCYVLQERHLHVDSILGSLFQRNVIDYHLMQCIEDEQVQFKKRRLLINHLCKQGHTVILTYCEILEQSASECVIPAHTLIASRVRKLLSEDIGEGSYDEWEEWEKEILLLLSFFDPTVSSQGVSPSGTRHPPRVQPTGVLTRKIHQIATNVVINLDRRMAEMVVDLLMGKDYPVDLKVAVLQVGCNDNERYIPKLESDGLALCRREDCQNPLTLQFRVHAHLAWCYFTIDSEKCEEHVKAALLLQHLVDHDVLSACLMLIYGASLAYDALQSGNLSPALEQYIAHTVIPAALHHGRRNAVNFNATIFLDMAMADVLFVYIVLAECHRRKGNRHEKTIYMMAMKKMAEKCDYNLIHSLLGNSETSWFGKLANLWKWPATIEELLECNDPSQLLRCSCVDTSKEVKVAPSNSAAAHTKLRILHQWLVARVPYPSHAVRVIFRLFRLVQIAFVFTCALFLHIL